MTNLNPETHKTATVALECHEYTLPINEHRPLTCLLAWGQVYKASFKRKTLESHSKADCRMNK